MGVKERHEREREATAGAILDAARELFVAEGYQNVSIRKIAGKIAGEVAEEDAVSRGGSGGGAGSGGRRTTTGS